MTGPPAIDDPVDDRTRLLRRITRYHLVPAPDDPLGQRVSSAAFQPSTADGGVSISIEDTVRALGIAPSDLMDLDKEAVGLCFVTAIQVRHPEVGKDVVRQPTIRDPSHGNIVGPDSTGRRKRLARVATAQWEIPPPSAA